MGRRGEGQFNEGPQLANRRRIGAAIVPTELSEKGVLNINPLPFGERIASEKDN